MPWRIIIIQKYSWPLNNIGLKCADPLLCTHMHDLTIKKKNSDSERYRHNQRKNRYDFDREKHLLRKWTQLKGIMLLIEFGSGFTLWFLRMEIFVSGSLINPVSLNNSFFTAHVRMELWGVPGVPCQGQATALPQSLYTNPGVPALPSPTSARSAPVSQKYLCFLLQACWEFSCTI